MPIADTPDHRALVDTLVVANRILAHHGIVDGFGHVSVRAPQAGSFLLSRSLAPGTVTAADIMRFDFDGTALDGDTRAPYLERFIHGEIFRARPDVMSVVHNHSPSVIPYGAVRQPLKPLYHMSAFIGSGSKHFEIRDAGGNTDMLVRNAALGVALAQSLADGSVVLMRGHGCTVVGESLEQAVYRAIYTEMNARLQLQASQLEGPIEFLSDEEGRRSSASNRGTLERPWELWKKSIP